MLSALLICPRNDCTQAGMQRPRHALKIAASKRAALILRSVIYMQLVLSGTHPR